MPNYSTNEVILVQYPFSDLSATIATPVDLNTFVLPELTKGYDRR
jgi:hypothetical protein